MNNSLATVRISGVLLGIALLLGGGSESIARENPGAWPFWNSVPPAPARTPMLLSPVKKNRNDASVLDRKTTPNSPNDSSQQDDDGDPPMQRIEEAHPIDDGPDHLPGPDNDAGDGLEGDDY